MGAANVIPGVSGGTIAFITNIYEKLISALKAFDLQALLLLVKFDFTAFSEKVSLKFLIALGAGVIISIISLAKLLEIAFTEYEILTLSFFFGLILASIFSVAKEVKPWDFSAIVSFFIGVIIAISIAFLPPATANSNLFYMFLCGIVAVCSMILPGLSGSYILLLMGNYVLVLQAISNFDLGILLPLLLGCVVGLIVFSRLLSYLFENFRNQTISLLSGFVAGSLVIIWPWKRTEYLEVAEGKIKAVGYSWYLPEGNTDLFIALMLMACGYFLVYFIDYLGSRTRNLPDKENN